MFKQTPSQTVGPFFHFSLLFGGENELVNEQTSGQHILIRGRVLDGDGLPVQDALVEIWQADAQGIFNHSNDPQQSQADPHFRGFGRSGTSSAGGFWFKTIKPGPMTGDEQQHAPYINVRVFARGMLIHAVTRLYFADEPANATDPTLNTIPPDRRSTLLAQPGTAADLPCYDFDIHLQGERETVFFDPS